MPCDEGCRTAVFGKTERTVGWEGNGDPAMIGLMRHCAWGNPQRTDRPCLPSLSHSFTLDYVACFGQEADARRFLTEMPQRLAQFALQVEPSKTALLRFGSHVLGRKASETQGPRTFRFLGFTHYVGRSRRGRFVVGRRTDAKRIRKKLKQLSERLRSLRSQGGYAMVAYTCRHLRGHIQYYGVSGNSRGVASYVYFATGLLFKWLNRRSQRRSLTWGRFGAVIRPLLPVARIVHDLYPMPSWKTQTGSRMV